MNHTRKGLAARVSAATTALHPAPQIAAFPGDGASRHTRGSTVRSQPYRALAVKAMFSRGTALNIQLVSAYQNGAGTLCTGP